MSEGRRIAEDDLARPGVRALLEAHVAHMQANSPACLAHAMPAEALQSPDITFFTVRDAASDELLGCGALKELAGGTAGEIKSMRTADAHLRRGVASAMLRYLIAESRRRGYERLCLETGSGEVFEPALRLYARFGFEPCPPFEGYEDAGTNAFSRFLHLELARDGC